jgi:hypothetical protein
MHEQKIKPVIPCSQQVSINDVYTFLAAVVQMGHNHKPSMELYWTKGGLYRIPFYSSVIPRDHFLIVLKHLYFVDNLKPITKTEKIQIMTDYGMSGKHLTSNRSNNGKIQRESHLLA